MRQCSEGGIGTKPGRDEEVDAHAEAFEAAERGGSAVGWFDEGVGGGGEVVGDGAGHLPLVGGAGDEPGIEDGELAFGSVGDLGGELDLERGGRGGAGLDEVGVGLLEAREAGRRGGEVEAARIPADGILGAEGEVGGERERGDGLIGRGGELGVVVGGQRAGGGDDAEDPAGVDGLEPEA